MVLISISFSSSAFKVDKDLSLAMPESFTDREWQNLAETRSLVTMTTKHAMTLLKQLNGCIFRLTMSFIVSTIPPSSNCATTTVEGFVNPSIMRTNLFYINMGRRKKKTQMKKTRKVISALRAVNMSLTLKGRATHAHLTTEM